MRKALSLPSLKTGAQYPRRDPAIIAKILFLVEDEQPQCPEITSSPQPSYGRIFFALRSAMELLVSIAGSRGCSPHMDTIHGYALPSPDSFSGVSAGRSGAPVLSVELPGTRASAEKPA
jgi:hypothetical protein